MRRLALLTCAGLLSASVAVPAASGRRHRVRTPPAVLGHTLTVDESEWTLRPSKTVVAAGALTLRVYNRGEDDHDMLLVTRDGARHVVALKPGESGTVQADVAPGRYTVICSLFAGTPDSHEVKGMAFVLTAR